MKFSYHFDTPRIVFYNLKQWRLFRLFISFLGVRLAQPSSLKSGSESLNSLFP